jgi:hypothetical protein
LQCCSLRQEGWGESIYLSYVTVLITQCGGYEISLILHNLSSNDNNGILKEKKGWRRMEEEKE